MEAPKDLLQALQKKGQPFTFGSEHHWHLFIRVHGSGISFTHAAADPVTLGRTDRHRLDLYPKF